MMLVASTYLLAAQAKKPPLNTAQLDLMLSYEAGMAPTRPAWAGSRPRRRLGGRYLRLPYQRAPDRPAAVLRRKRLALTSPVPVSIGCLLTESQRAFARVVRDDWERNGLFDACHDEAAARIGTCSKTIMRAQMRLEELGLISVELRPVPGQKHETNIVRIISPQWLAWIARKPPTPGGHVVLATVATLNKERLSQPLCQEKRQPAPPHAASPGFAERIRAK